MASATPVTFETWRQLFLWPRVRPWALLTPVMVLLVATPMIASLWTWPLSGEAGYWLAQGRSVAETGALARLPGEPASTPPVFGVLVGAITSLLMRLFPAAAESDQSLHFFLTSALATIPAAIGGGLIYRMGRLFELRRGRRALLACGVVLASGWLGFATQLQPAALAIAALLAAWTCILYVAAAKRPRRVLIVCLPAGTLLTLAALLSPTLMPISIASALAIVSISMKRSLRAVALALLVAGAVPLVLTQLAWTLSLSPAVPSVIDWATLEERSESAQIASRGLATFLPGGWLFQFPIALLGIVCAWAIVRRHWPAHAKFLAAATLLALLLALVQLLFASPAIDPRLLLAPLLLWVGQALRHVHRPWLRALAVALLLVSVYSTLQLAIEPTRMPPPLTFAATSLR